MAMGAEFCLLGPLVVRCGGAPIPVPPGNQRAVLATLLLNANHVVPLDDLAESLWGSAPPPSARVTVQNYVLRLRKALAATGPPRILTLPPGYMIKVAADELDVSRFEALLTAARAAALDGSWDAAAGQARAALSLWRGEPLADTGSDFLVVRETPRLAEMRLQAMEVRIDADLHLGRNAAVIAELQRLVDAHPLREHLHALLMLALYRDGRRGEALAAYQHARRVLIEELGTEPGPGLRDLHQRILTADPTLAVPEPAQPAAGDPGPVVPWQLPGAVAHFGGRAAELATLTKLLDDTGQQALGQW
ncbi:MAG: AfsR/SARP family transcriptional regulator [Streptosporangiaceae bacterium]